MSTIVERGSEISINLVVQGSIATGVKLEDGKGTAASGFFSSQTMNSLETSMQEPTVR